jgi:hypothetical protein
MSGFFFFTKVENKQEKQVLSGILVPMEGRRIKGKDVGG